jgi:hypothetical protein
MQLTAMIVNFIYSVIGGVLTLLFVYFGYKWFDRFTTFDTSDQLAKYRTSCTKGSRLAPWRNSGLC